jgi:hypothetical protein
LDAKRAHVAFWHRTAVSRCARPDCLVFAASFPHWQWTRVFHFIPRLIHIAAVVLLVKPTRLFVMKANVSRVSYRPKLLLAAGGGTGVVSLSQSCPGCITITFGYNFRKGHVSREVRDALAHLTGTYALEDEGD